MNNRSHALLGAAVGLIGISLTFIALGHPLGALIGASFAIGAGFAHAVVGWTSP
jgi:hypothetical protein